MQPTQRTRRSRLIEALFTQPEKFHFFQAVRLLALHWNRASGKKPAQLVGDSIRFRNSLELSFPPSEIESIRVQEEPLDPVTEGESNTARPRLKGVELTTTFMGLTGVAGVLPRHYTETLAEREIVYRDRAARRFLDLFSSRMVGFFYEAWRKYRLPLQHEAEPGRHYLPQLLMLAGHMPERVGRGQGTAKPSALPQEFFAYYAGILRQKQLSPTNLQRVLADFFEVPVRIEPFVGRWFSVPEEQLTRLGGEASQLGLTSFCGERVWQRDHRLRLTFGPLNAKENADFLPGGRSMRALREILKRCYGLTLEFEILLILRNAEARPAQLGEGELGAHLGRNSFLATQAFTHDVQHVRYEINFGSAAV